MSILDRDPSCHRTVDSVRVIFDDNEAGNQMESTGSVRADCLDTQFATLEKVLRAAISEAVAEQLVPLLEKMQMLIDSTSKDEVLSPNRTEGAANCEAAAERALSSHESEADSVQGQEAHSSKADHDFEPPRHCRHHSVSNASLDWLQRSDIVAHQTVQSLLDELGLSMSQKLSGFVRRHVDHFRDFNDIRTVVDSPVFVGLISLVLLLNALFIGYQTHMELKQLSTGSAVDSIKLTYVSRAFSAVFVIELALRFLVQKVGFFRGPDWNWNLFDTVMVLTSVIDEIMGRQVNLSAARVIRIQRMFRMIRVLKILRVLRAFDELRTFFSFAIAAMRAVMWSLVFLGIVIYLFAVWFMQVSINIIVKDGSRLRDLQDGWGSVDRAMYTLLACVTGGQDWTQSVAAFDKDSLWHRAVFSFYIVFVMIGLFNVLTGIFAGKAVEAHSQDRAMKIFSEIEQKKSVVEELCGMFLEIDQERCGKVAVHQLREYLTRTEVQAYLATQHLHSGDPKQLISMLDPQKTGKVTLHQFIVGCLRHRGPARSLEIASMLTEQRRQAKILENLAHDLKKQRKSLPQRAQLPADESADKHPPTPMNMPETMQTSHSHGSASNTPTHREEIRKEMKPNLEQQNCVGSFQAEINLHNVDNSEQTKATRDTTISPTHTVSAGQTGRVAL